MSAIKIMHIGCGSLLPFLPAGKRAFQDPGGPGRKPGCWHMNCRFLGTMKTFRFPVHTIIGFICLLSVETAHATQGHGAPEGLYAHQFSHLFFIFAMGILIYWLRSRSLVKEPGWRYLQYAGLFFLLWSLDAFCVHLLDEQLQWIRAEQVNLWQVRIHAPASMQWLGPLYYLIKLDHLLCVPGMIFLVLALRRLSRRAEAAGSAEGEGL